MSDREEMERSGDMVHTTIRLSEIEKKEFSELCKATGTTMSREIRKFIRAKLKENPDLIQDLRNQINELRARIVSAEQKITEKEIIDV